MDELKAETGCLECGRRPADQWLDGDGPLCDPCLDGRISTATGMPKLPLAPPPIEVEGGDGRRHVLRYRLWRAPTGISVRLVEECRATDEGFEFGVLGDHDADVNQLLARVRAKAEAEISHCYLEPDPRGTGWRLADEEVAGRLVWNPDGSPFRVVVDGRTLSWAELGEALSSFEGCRFRLTIDDSLADARSEAAKAALGGHGTPN
ncbi:hypothetical protein C9F11_43230 (plasmid) [Streptomyces sp. YIM 121038]|uniref:DUF7686 domain-containing protein n=1 Tax=Streptomyces sp. YIM 121038 TaxID=2136401 RepID=UPI0011104DB2|nr:hypothetical protein [Streptomyces sp. YIM 121038]QCX82226.1 hypothetical protein C9F11_43230 [Streptomyces sp. YIM 121038]